jgi:hypothetical protein
VELTAAPWEFPLCQLINFGLKKKTNQKSQTYFHRCGTSNATKNLELGTKAVIARNRLGTHSGGCRLILKKYSACLLITPHGLLYGNPAFRNDRGDVADQTNGSR